jgi:hypothetical protein
MTQHIDFHEAETLGWEFEARKGHHVLRGLTVPELKRQILDREATLSESRESARRRENHAAISQLFRRLGALEAEHERERTAYRDESKSHYVRMRALEWATGLRKRTNETLEKLLEHEKEDLLSHDGFRELQQGIKDAQADGEEQ